MAAVKPQPKEKLDGPTEPKPILFLGGPDNARKRADKGYSQWTNSQGDLYRRVRLTAGDALGQLTFDAMVYFGKSWNEAIETGEKENCK